jgi:hypothetical protein
VGRKQSLLTLSDAVCLATEEVDYVEGVDDGLVSYMEEIQRATTIYGQSITVDTSTSLVERSDASVCGAVLAAVTVVLASQR